MPLDDSNLAKDILVDGKLVTSIEARDHFELVADMHNFSGQQREQYLVQAIKQGSNLAQKHIDATKPDHLIIPYTGNPTWVPMGQQQQRGAQLSTDPEERNALLKRQIQAQKAMLAANMA